MSAFTAHNYFWWFVFWLAFGKVIIGIVWTMLTQRPALLEHRIYRIEIPDGQRQREIKSSWHVISDAIVLVAVVGLGWINLASNTPINTLLTFAVFYCWVEAWYYAHHRLMHERDWLYKYHKSHHLSKVVTPLSSISMSWVEKCIFYTGGWLGFMTLISWVVPVTLHGIAAYYTFHFIISLHGHSNTEPSALGRLMTKLNMGSATSHALHHSRMRVNYGFSCMLLDKLLGSYAEETPVLQENALKGNGATSLRPEYNL